MSCHRWYVILCAEHVVEHCDALFERDLVDVQIELLPGPCPVPTGEGAIVISRQEEELVSEKHLGR